MLSFNIIQFVWNDLSLCSCALFLFFLKTVHAILSFPFLIRPSKDLKKLGSISCRGSRSRDGTVVKKKRTWFPPMWPRVRFPRGREVRWPHCGLVSRSRGAGSSPGRGHCAVFLGKTRNNHSASLCQGVYIGTSEFIAAMD